MVGAVALGKPFERAHIGYTGATRRTCWKGKIAILMTHGHAHKAEDAA